MNEVKNEKGEELLETFDVKLKAFEHRLDVDEREIQILKESDTRQRIQLSNQQIQLTNIEKGQANIEKELANVMMMITASSKETSERFQQQQKENSERFQQQQRENGERFQQQQQMLNSFTEKVLDTMTNNISNDNKTRNNIKWHRSTQFWGIVVIVATALSGLIGAFSALLSNK